MTPAPDDDRRGDGSRLRPLRVAAFTGGAMIPSARFRVRQYIGALAKYGIIMQEHWAALGSYPPRSRPLRPFWLMGTLAQRLPQIMAGWRADITLLQREIVSTLPTVEGWTRRPRVLDIDDSVHLRRQGVAARALARRADLVVVGNIFLAEVWRRWNPNVEIVPTAVDTDFYSGTSFPEHPTIGWIGTADNLPYLATIAPALGRILHWFPHTTIAICCDRQPHLPGLPVRYIRWSADIEPKFLTSITIGIMPLPNSAWGRGKCSLKMLQYMAAGRPCVVSPVGMNHEILRQGSVGLAAVTIPEWREALAQLLSDPSAAQRLGAAGRALAVERYSIATVAPRLAGILRSVV